MGYRGEVPRVLRSCFQLPSLTVPPCHVSDGAASDFILRNKGSGTSTASHLYVLSGDAFAKLGYSSVDKFVDDVRGR